MQFLQTDYVRLRIEDRDEVYREVLSPPTVKI